MLLLVSIDGRNHDLLKRLAHLDVHLAAQGEHHRSDALGHLHASFEVEVDGSLIDGGELVEMHAVALAAEVLVELVGIEGCEGSQEFGNGHQAGVERLVGRALVVAHLLAPEAFAVESHVPVGEVVVDKLVDESSGTSGVEALELLVDGLDERVDARENPAVDLGLLLLRHGRNILCRGPFVDIGIEGEERVGIEERAEELAAHLVDALRVELQVVPRLGVGHHVEAHGIGTILLNHVERIHHVAHVLRHLVALGIEHESGGNDVLEGHRVEHHRGDGMQGEEPTACLVDTLVDEVGGEGQMLVDGVAVLEGIVHLCVGHSTRVEPHVDEVALAVHGLALLAHEDDVVDIGAVQVDAVVVLARHIAHDEALVL